MLYFSIYPQDGPFPWDETVQGIILASYFYGYIVTQVQYCLQGEYFNGNSSVARCMYCTTVNYIYCKFNLLDYCKVMRKQYNIF